MSEILAAQNLSFSYPGGENLFAEVSFSLQRGEVLGVIGPSGCGKSTLALALCGIIPHSLEGVMGGHVFLLGENTRKLTLPQIATRAGIVFQDPETQLFLPEIRHELAFGPENLCLPREEIASVIAEVAGMTDMEHLMPHNPNEISGGQQQLVALAAVLCLDPDLLILDEVASQLDEETGALILEVIGRLKRKGKAMVMIDHNLSRLGLADRILVMGSGRIHAIGCPQDILKDRALLERCFGEPDRGAAS